MSASLSSALAAATQAAAGQNHPQGALYMVATPIGNLADITLRALHVLQLADTVACEDTRHTQHLLRAYGIQKAGGQLLALHQHNEEQVAQLVVERLRHGQRVAYVSDAGTPGVSDPGARLAASVRGQGLRAIPLPGASSVTALLSVSGVVGDFGSVAGFVFWGFLPTKASERTQAIEALAQEPRAVVVLEAPHRIEALAGALTTLGDRTVTLGRELTKQFEEIATVPAAGLSAWLREDGQRVRGEFTLVVHPAPVQKDTHTEVRVLGLLLEELPLKTAVRLAAAITGAPRNAVYAQALELSRSAAREAPEA